MKKILSYMLLALTGVFFAACNEDFTDWASQQTYLPEDAITIPGFTATAIGAVDLNNEGDEVQLLSLSKESLPEGYEIKSLRIFVVPADATEDVVATEITADANSNFSKADLQTLIEQAYGKRPVNRVFKAHVYASAVKDGQAALIDAGVVELNITPEAPQISENYYIVGGTLDWAGSAASKEQKFSHSDKDVYEDPVFSIVINAGEGDTWFAIGDDEACDAITYDGDWSKLFGTKKGNGNTDLTGSLDRRYNLSDDGSFCVPAGNKKIKVTINMMDYTYEITPVNIAENYYLIGGPGNWDSSKDQKFSHSSKDVFDDPVFTYVFAGTGSEMWFAFGDDEAIDAVGEGTWNKLFGTTGNSTDLSGSFDRRYNLDGDHSFCVDGTAKYYRFSVNMAEMTYEITPLDFAQFVYFIGATDGWSASDQKLESPNNDGIYTGYLYVADPNGWGVEFKFQKIPGDWGDDSQLNSNNMNDVTGDFEKTGDNFKASAGEGVYYVTLDLGNKTLNGVKINNMNLVGDFNGWNPADDAQRMTWDADNFCYVITGAGVTANGWKFTANNDWGINLGGDTLDDLVANGANISAVGTTIKLYPTRKTSDKIYCTVE
ncbi:MAG: DUF5115 domain-containing protein [Prevotella sp.]|nr:DUF5115 domain-containing protein [Prevotella sp.]